MDFSKICRTCLGSENLNPIFNRGVDDSRYFYAIYWTAGVKVRINDGLPQNMCTQCLVHLNNALKYRKLSQDSEKQLLSLKDELNVTEECKKDNIKQNDCHMPPSLEEDTVNIKSENVKAFSDDDNLLSGDEKSLADDERMLPNDESPLIDNDADGIVQNNIGDGNHYEGIVRSQSKGSRVTCNLCQVELSVRSVAGHMARRHPGADETKAKCELCEVYVTRNRMNRHKLMMHGNQGFKCGYCKTDFGSKEILLDHVSGCSVKKKKRKAPESSRQLSECDICHKTMQKASLRLHKEVKHAGLRPVCEHCGERFGNKYRLSEHYRAKHGYEKFKCSYCDFESAAIVAMRNHERRHRGEKPFVCKSCGAKFHAAYLLAQHKKSHRTEKLIKCEQCPARFKANNSLNMHKLTCHSASLYRCTMCVRTYSCRHYAVKHLRQVHQYTGPVPRLQRVLAKPEDDEV